MPQDDRSNSDAASKLTTRPSATVFDAIVDEIEAGQVTKYRLTQNSELLSYVAVLELWINEMMFRCFCTELLKKSPFTAFRWETPVLTTTTMTQPFEFVLLDSPSFSSRAPDVETFSEHFEVKKNGDAVDDKTGGKINPTTNEKTDGAIVDRAGDKNDCATSDKIGGAIVDRVDEITGDETTWANSIAHVSNLGGDASILIPSPRAAYSAYGHFAAFLRGAPTQQIDAMWRAIGTQVSGQLSEQPLWLNTAGGGVAWLHVRLDSRPKYYGYTPYKARP